MKKFNDSIRTSLPRKINAFVLVVALALAVMMPGFVTYGEDSIIEEIGAAAEIPPSVWIIHSADDPTALRIDVVYDLAQTTPQGAAMRPIHGFFTAWVMFLHDNEPVDISEEYTLRADLSWFYTANLNPYRIIALLRTDDAWLPAGGSFDQETGQFELTTDQQGEFMIAHAEHLVRLRLGLHSPVITDLAGNAPTQAMDVLPIIEGGITLIPIRFIAEALGADVGWLSGIGDAPHQVTITNADRTLTFPIGALTPELAALGMDAPAQIVRDRTMMPLQFVSEFFGAMVLWDEDAQGVEIFCMPYGQ